MEEIKRLKDEVETKDAIIKLLEQDIADRDKMLEAKVEDVYADFMQDYKLMREELDGAYRENTALAEEVARLKQYNEALSAEVVRLIEEKAAYRKYVVNQECVCCGKKIPEGRQVCPSCEKGA